MGEINRRYFDGLLSDRRMSLRELARRMGMNHSQLSLTFSGTRRAQLDEAAQLAEIFGEPLQKVVEALGVNLPQTAGRRVAVIGSVGGDGVVTPYGPDVVERTGAPDELPGDCVALQFRTSGTKLDWMDGFVVFCKQHNGMDPALLGRCCWAKIKGGPQVISTIKRGYRDGTMNLSGPYVQESAAIEWATPALITRN